VGFALPPPIFKKMIQIKNCLSKKEKFEISVMIKEIKDPYAEFFITKNRMRLFIKENLNSLFSSLKKGDKICFDEEGIGVITGFAEKEIEIINYTTKRKTIVPSRKYVIILSKNEKNANKLLEFINWQFPKETLFAKLKKNNPLLKTYYFNKWAFRGGRVKEY